MSVRLKSTKLINKSGNEVSAAKALGSKVVFLYFSAHWCPPCRQFTPMLKQFYSKMKGGGFNIEIVFVSSDKSEQEMMSYFQNDHGDYLAVKFAEDDRIDLSRDYDIRGIPTLCAIDKDGKTLAQNQEVRDLVIQNAQGVDVSSTLSKWQRECGDWKTTKGVKLSDGTSSSRKMSREEMRAARLAALEKSSSVAKIRSPISAEPEKDAKVEANTSLVEKRRAPAATIEASGPVAKTSEPSSLEQLVAMGFATRQAAQTLEACGGNLDTALAILLS